MIWTSLTVEWKGAARRDLARLDTQARVRVVRAVTRYAETGHGAVRRLRGSAGEYRLRVGDLRVRFVVEVDRRALVVLHVLHRREAY